MSPELASLMGGLMQYAAWSTGLPVPNGLPSVQWDSQCEIEADYYGDPVGAPCRDGSTQVLAIFKPNEDLIRFSFPEVDPSTIAGKSIILHELVHWVQNQALESMNATILDLLQTNGGCYTRTMEAPAYAAQWNWIRENKQDPWTTLETAPMVVFLATSCRPVYEN